SSAAKSVFRAFLEQPRIENKRSGKQSVERSTFCVVLRLGPPRPAPQRFLQQPTQWADRSPETAPNLLILRSTEHVRRGLDVFLGELGAFARHCFRRGMKWDR